MSLLRHIMQILTNPSVFNDVTKKLLYPKLAKEFLTHENIGKELLENFIKEGFE